MAKRINLGEPYESENGEEKYRFWVEVSSSLMSEVTARAIEEGDDPREMLSQAVGGEMDLGSGESDGDESGEADGDTTPAEADD